MSKMYIAVLDEFPDFMTPTLVAHAVLQHDMVTVDRFHEDLDYLYKYLAWMNDSFKKVVVRVNQKEFDKISTITGVTLSHENHTLDVKKACAVVVVDEDIPNVLKFAKLWAPESKTEPFKVGHRVKSITNDCLPFHKIGDTGTVIGVEGDILHVQFDKPHYRNGKWWVELNDVERI